VVWWQTLLAILIVALLLAVVLWYVRSGKDIIASKLAALKAKPSEKNAAEYASETVVSDRTEAEDGELAAAITAAIYCVLSEEAKVSDRPALGFVVKRIRKL
jgi:putative exporter of polyketide antibiotics